MVDRDNHMMAVDLNGIPTSEFHVGDKTETDKDDKDSEAISFSLLVYDLKQQITCKVSPDDSLWTLKRQLISNTSAKKFADGLNYGFYCPASAGRVGKYLGETRPIKEFSHKDLEDLQFRYKKKYYKNLPGNLKKLKNVNDLSHRKTFIQAINSNKMNDVIKMLHKGLDPNYQDFRTGETPMTAAILSGAPKEFLVRLVEEGAHLDYRNTCEMTPVHVAAINGKVEYLKTLLELGASANYRSSDNLTPLHCLSSGTNLDTLVSCSQLLLENYSVVDVADDTGNTELHHAAKQGRLLLAKKLIIYGANINRRNAVGNTPLHMALFNNQEEMAKKLLIYGADKGITNRANYDALAAAMTVENELLINYIQQFDPSQTVPIKEAPIYHSKRKPDNSRRPSMQAFLLEQQKQVQRTSKISKQLSCPEGRNDRKADTISTGLTTPDTQDVEKIGDYITSIFGSIQEGDESVKLSKEKSNNNNKLLLLPIFENQRASSFTDVRTNRSRLDSFDEFTDSEEETEITPVVARPKALNTQARPATMYHDLEKPMRNTESSSALLAFALQKHLRQNASAYSLPTQSSPLPVAKLQPKVNSQQDMKVASIKSYPKRLTNAETGLMVSRYEKSSSTIAERQKDPWSEASLQSATINAVSVKHRPSLKDVFPYGSATNIATEANNGLDKPLPDPHYAVPVTAGRTLILEQSELPKIAQREHIYEEIPSVKVTSFEVEEEEEEEENSGGASLGYAAAAAQFGLGAADTVDWSVAQGRSTDSDEIYANIGPGGQVLSFYHDYRGAPTRQDRVQTSPPPVLNLVDEDGDNQTEEFAKRMTDAVTTSVMVDLNQSLGSADEPQRVDSKHLWLQQQLYLQGKPQQFPHSMQVQQGPSGHNQELENKLMNQRTKMEKPLSLTENKQFHTLVQQQPYVQQEQIYGRQQQQHPLHHQNYPQLNQQELTDGRTTRGPPIEIRTLPRQKYRETNQRPMTSFFETNQLSLSSLDHGDTMFDTLPGRLRAADKNKMEKSSSVTKLNDIAGDAPPPYTPFFVTKPAKPSYHRTNSNQPVDPIEIPNSLNIFQHDLYKASSYQDVRSKGSPPQANRLNYPRIPPKPPKRMSSIPSSNSTISVAPSPPPSYFHHDKQAPADSLGITPPRDVEHHVTMRVKPTLDIPRGRPGSRSMTSSPNRNSSFESFLVPQNEIKKKLEQLRLSSGEEVPGYSIHPMEYVAPITIVEGKTTGKDFNENRAKLERLLSGEVGGASPRGVVGHPGGYLHHDQDLKPKLKVDEATGRAYLEMEGTRLEEWSV